MPSQALDNIQQLFPQISFVASGSLVLDGNSAPGLPC